MPGDLRWAQGGGAVSYERGTSVLVERREHLAGAVYGSTTGAVYGSTALGRVLQGYLAHEKTPTRHRHAVGS